MKPKYITSISALDNLVGLAPKEREMMERVTDVFPFRANDYYLSLIDWKDRRDPIKAIIVPDPRELESGGSDDPSCEKDYTKKPGLQHKYDQTGLLLLTDVCGGICRFCFRKRLFMSCERETVRDVSENLEYIREHKEITNVLLTGGDPLTLDTRHLESVLRELREIPHVNIIRIGSKMLAYDPYRILNDPELLFVLSRYSTPEKRIYLMAHFNHPNEITEVSIEAAEALQKSGVIVVNQTPILNGINSDPETLTTLFRKLSFAGISPYYVFQCRPATGNGLFQLPVETSYDILQESWKNCSGLAKRARLIMSHSTGKVEVVGKDDENVFMRYHQAADDDDIGKFMTFPTNPKAEWFDDYLAGQNPVKN
ncbi:MAG: KamA family radical SAM protein [Methanocorpusculum sp.]|nr:KamA family radical SAM protein [Methanocorpusculum sp.]MDD2803430.1 KamA family radical SAM protein [Methanocorpusculum sp.]MDD3047197.1 KamA family radical SAM protein [Methanocorpusculum sp.]MDD3912537.1 KamA family radical SAM protein [Methanocorpusculum sp.]